jgi:hypothetical protein
MIFPALWNIGAKPRFGQVTLIAGPPKAFKSGFAQYWTTRLCQKGLGILYFSADTSAQDVKVRLATMLTGHTNEAVDQAFLSGNGAYYDQALDDLKGMRYDFHSSPSYDHITELTLAYNELFGDYPSVVVLDNLMNMESQFENEWQGMKEFEKFVKYLGRETGAAVFILHHMNEIRDPRFPAPRRDVAGKVNQLPELILSVAADDGVLRIAAVGNRSGKQDPNAENPVELYVDITRMAIYQSRYDMFNGVNQL